MTLMRTKIGTSLAICAVMLTGGVVIAQSDGPPIEIPVIPEYDAGEQPDGPDALATNCRFDFEYRNDVDVRAFNWCFSDDGNIASIENSAGLEHVAVGTLYEGWCVSAGHTVRGITWGTDANVGLGDPIYTDPKKVAHRTTDGKLRVESGFGTSPGNKKMVITMKVRNVGTNPLTNVYLTRFIDADLSNTTGSDVWASGSRSVSVSEPGSSRLELIPDSYFYPANSMIYSSFVPTLDQDCYDAAADATLEDTGDRSMGVMYQLGTIFPGEDKTVRFAYRISI